MKEMGKAKTLARLAILLAVVAFGFSNFGASFWGNLGFQRLAESLRLPKAHAAIAIDATSTASAGAVSSLTWTHTVGSGLSNSLLVVGVSIEKSSGAMVQSIT